MMEGLKTWYKRAQRVIRGRDLLWVSPAGVAVIIGQLMAQRLGTAKKLPPCNDLEAYDLELIDVFADLFRVLGKYYFRLEVQGVEHVPLTGPALFVGNHNGAILPIDTIFTVIAVYDHTKSLGHTRLLRGLGHDSIFAHPVIRDYAMRLGALQASPQTAERLLRAGHMALVYPGSDIEACRTFAERNRIMLAGRRGFLRVALRTGAPIVPVVSVGTHEQLIILTRGERLAEVLRLHKLMRTDTCPLALSVPWGLSSALIPYVPLPAQTSLCFGEPLRFPDIKPEQANDDVVLARCYQLVESRMQAMLDELSRDRIPLLGKLHPQPRP